MNALILIFSGLLGISLIGTVTQHKNKVFSNSQNMFFGCLGGLISYFCGFSISTIIIVTIICAIISAVIFKYVINPDIFIIKSNKLESIIIFFAICLTALVPIYCIFSLMIFSFKQKDIIAILFCIVMVVGIITSILKAIKFLKKFNFDKFEDGEIIYIVDNFLDRYKYSKTTYKNKKFYTRNMHSIINKKRTVNKLGGEYLININGISYSIIEKNGELLKSGDIVRISKDNLNQGIIKQSTTIIVEKITKVKKKSIILL